MTTSTDFIASNGSYNIAAIMKVAHLKARHEFNKSICFVANAPVRKSRIYGEQIAIYADGAAKVDRRSIKIPACLSYAIEFQKALADCWFQARVLRGRSLEAIARAPAPVLLLAA